MEFGHFRVGAAKPHSNAGGVVCGEVALQFSRRYDEYPRFVCANVSCRDSGTASVLEKHVDDPSVRDLIIKLSSSSGHKRRVGDRARAIVNKYNLKEQSRQKTSPKRRQT